MSCESNCGPLTVTLLTGAPGVQGTQGVQGPAGPAGPQGPQGPAGSVGTVTGDMSITTEGVATLATVGLAAVVGGAAKALTLQVDAKGRVLAVTAQDASITTSQVQNLSLATLGGVATTDPRLSDARIPTGTASGDLAGTYPAPTLATVGTAGVTGDANKTLVIQTDAKGRTVAVTAQAISITTGQVQNLSLATLGGVSTTDPRLSDSRTPTGAASGDLAGMYPAPTLGIVGTAGVTGEADKTLVIQTDAKGRLLAATAQAISITTSQVQNLSLATLGGVATTDPRLSDARTPSGAAGGDLAGTYPNPTLSTVTTAGSVGSETVVPVVTIDAKGRVTALGSAQIAALTTAQVAGLSTATPAAIATTGAVGTSTFAARADHVHALSTLGVAGTFGSASAVPVVTVDAFGRVASVTTAGIPSGLSLTTADAAPLGAVASAGVSTLAARGDHVHQLPTAAQIGALTTAQIQSLSTSTPAAIATAGVVGLSVYPARQDHQHALATLGTAGTFGSSSAVPVVTVDAFGRVASVTTAEITGGGGAPVATDLPLGLATAGVAGIGTAPAAWDHRHPVFGDVSAAESGELTVVALQGQNVAATTPTSGQVLAYNGTEWAPAAGGEVNVVTGSQISSFTGDGSTTEFSPLVGYTTTAVGSYSVSVGGIDQRPTVDYTISASGNGTIVFASAPPSGAPIVVRAYTGGSGGGVSLTTEPAYSLATAGFAGLSTEAARADHKHPISGDVISASPGASTVRVVGLLNSEIPTGSGYLRREINESWSMNDSLIPNPASTLPAGLSLGGSTGVDENYARADHQHPIGGDVEPNGTSGDVTVTGLQNTQIVGNPFPGGMLGYDVSQSGIVWAGPSGDVAQVGNGILNLQVQKIRGQEISETAPTLNDALVWDGARWAPTNLNVPSAPTVNPSSVSTVSQIGTSGNFAREDHVHTLEFFEYTPEYLKATPSAGTSSYPARSDHAHAIQGDIVVDPNQAGSTLVNALQRYPVNAYSPANNTVLQFQNGAWAPADYKSYINNAISYLNTAFSANLTLIP